MSRRSLVSSFSLAWILACVSFTPLFAANIPDGFESKKEIRSKYFQIHLGEGVDEMPLSTKLILPSSIQALAQQEFEGQGGDLGVQMDMLLTAVSKIMDLRLSKLSATIKICGDGECLERVGKKLFGRAVKTGGFFVPDMNTLYVDAKGVNLYILAHEMSHAVQIHYFVVPPPEKVQEVLAGYVEYELRKYNRDMPVRVIMK